MRDLIVAIDLGTFHIVGVVGEKHADGTYTIVAHDTEKTQESCIRRGNIVNLEKTAACIKSLISKLQSTLDGGGEIKKLYVGVGGQSLRAIDHAETKQFTTDSVVTETDIQVLNDQCEAHIPDLTDVLAIVPSVYLVDGQLERSPVGMPCRQLEARYKLIIGRPSIRRNLVSTLERAGVELAGIFVSPLLLGEAMLSAEEKELGCAVVDFGAGVTSFSVFKKGYLE